jgi:hypothetical protein
MAGYVSSVITIASLFLTFAVLFLTLAAFNSRFARSIQLHRFRFHGAQYSDLKLDHRRARSGGISSLR